MGKKAARRRAAAAHAGGGGISKRPHQKQLNKHGGNGGSLKHRDHGGSATKQHSYNGSSASASSSARPLRCPYSAQHRTLLLGEGDLSFAVALSLVWRTAASLTATTFDDEATARTRYVKFEENAQTVRDLGGAVAFGVDAARCATNSTVRRALYDRIIFNFPHAGAGIKDQQRNIATNQALLRGTFSSAPSLLAPGGQLHVTLKRGEPYDSWSIVTIAKLCGLRVQHCTPFAPEAYPGYAHRRTLGDEHAGDQASHEANAEIHGARTYAFVRADDEEAAGGGSGGAGRADAPKNKKGGTRGGNDPASKDKRKKSKAIFKSGPFGSRKL